MLKDSQVMSRDAVWAFKEKASKLKLRLVDNSIHGKQVTGVVRLVGGKKHGKTIDMHTEDLPRFLSAYETCVSHQKQLVNHKKGAKK